MKRFVVCALFALSVLTVAGTAEQARAQYSQPQRLGPVFRPPVSPYLNLLRRGSDPAVNYYGIVRPEIEFRSGLQNLQQQVNTVGQDVTAQDQALGLLPATGHPVQFFNYSHYFGQGFNGGTGTQGAPRPAAAASAMTNRPPTRSGGIRPPTTR